MIHLRTFLRRLPGMFWNYRAEQDLSAELQAHLVLLVEENVRKGMRLAEARHAARVDRLVALRYE